MNLSLGNGVINLTNKLFHNGKEKEIKFIEVDEKNKKVSIYFKDFTFVSFDDLKLIVKRDDLFWS